MSKGKAKAVEQEVIEYDKGQARFIRASRKQDIPDAMALIRSACLVLGGAEGFNASMSKELEAIEGVLSQTVDRLEALGRRQRTAKLMRAIRKRAA